MVAIQAEKLTNREPDFGIAKARMDGYQGRYGALLVHPAVKDTQLRQMLLKGTAGHKTGQGPLVLDDRGSFTEVYSEYGDLNTDDLGRLQQSAGKAIESEGHTVRLLKDLISVDAYASPETFDAIFESPRTD